MNLVERLTGWWPGRGGGGVGPRGERAAARHLRRAGYRILAANLRSRFGEIDLLAEAPDRRTLVIVEVKARAIAEGQSAGIRPEVHVNAAKQRQLVALAQQIARRYHLSDRPIRFDVIGVDLPNRGHRGQPVIRHHVCAFEARA